MPGPIPSSLESYIGILAERVDVAREIDRALDQLSSSVSRMLALNLGLSLAIEELGWGRAPDKVHDNRLFQLIEDRIALGSQGGEQHLVEERAAEQLRVGVETAMRREDSNGSH